MSALTLSVNGLDQEVNVPPEMPLLWVLRDVIGLTGTKFSCGIGACGCCTVHVDGAAQKSCLVSAGEAAGHAITTIEGLSADGDHPVQQAWIEEQVVQCGYCQAGQIMTAAALLSTSPNPSDPEIDAAMAGVLCRCGTYQRVRRGVHRAAEMEANHGRDIVAASATNG